MSTGTPRMPSSYDEDISREPEHGATEVYICGDCLAGNHLVCEEATQTQIPGPGCECEHEDLDYDRDWAAEVSAADPMARTMPGHPIKEGAGYDCCCDACLSLPARKAEMEAGQ